MVRLNNKGKQTIDDFGANNPAPGLYHAYIKDVDESEERFPAKVVVEFEVLAGSTPGQAEKTHTEFFSLSEKALPRLQRLAMATGLIGPDEEKDVSFNDAVGKDCVVEVEEQMYEGKKRSRLTFMGIWNTDHPKVRDVPKGKEFRYTKEDAAADKAAEADEFAGL
jgi:hypothetical protein